MTSSALGVIVRELILKRDNHTCQKCDKRKQDRELVVHHLKYPAKSLSDLVLLCRDCHPVGRKINIPKKAKRLTELASLLDGEMRDAQDIASKYNRRFKKTLSRKIVWLNLLELCVWAAEGKINSKSKIKCKPTSMGYLFWSEEEKK